MTYAIMKVVSHVIFDDISDGLQEASFLVPHTVQLKMRRAEIDIRIPLYRKELIPIRGKLLCD